MFSNFVCAFAIVSSSKTCLVFIVASPRFDIACACCAVGLTRFTSEFFRAFPDCEPFIPLLAISPRAIAKSSADEPIAPATGATYLKLSPMRDTFVFAFDDADARTSAKCPDSSALIPRAVKASVTISEVVASSSPLAAARFITPSMPSSISLVFHPAIAMKFNASADSVAENFVSEPISFALSLKSSISSVLALDVAFTFDIAESKSIPTFIASVANSFSLLIAS